MLREKVVCVVITTHVRILPYDTYSCDVGLYKQLLNVTLEKTRDSDAFD